MKGLVRSLVISALLLFGAVTASPAAADPPTPAPGLPLQLALGDSWAAGFGDTEGEGGYVPDLYATLKKDFNCSVAPTEEPEAGCKHLQLLNIAEGGETTPSMIEEQFPVAIPLLEARNRNVTTVEVITLHIGGNDLFGPIIFACGAGSDPLQCQLAIQAALTGYQNNLDTALSTLRNAAGPNARIVIGTYDNPFRFTPCVQVSGIQGVSVLADFVLEGGPGFQGLHDRMRTVAADPDVQAEVADVFGELDSPGDWLSSQQPPEDRTDCLHPTDSGYDKVTDAFEEVLGVGQSG